MYRILTAAAVGCLIVLVVGASVARVAHAWPPCRNIVKALPWFADVRIKINDPQYSGWFLHQKDNASALYHDVYGGISPQADCGGVACGVSSRPVLQLCMPYVAKL